MIEYSFSKTVHNEHPFDEVTDFLLKVPCQGKADTIDYIYRLYRFGADLYITDIFPKMYEGDSRCFKRFTSHEGYNVNMRSLAVSCLRIFVNEIISANHDAVMVVSGSYADGEDEDGPSRKLKLYWYCFKPLLGELNLRMVDVSGHNAFMLLRGDSGVSDDLLMRQYLAFKSRGIVTCDRELEDNVFVVPTRDVEWPYLVYAPLAGRYLFADSEGLSSIDTIKQALKHSSNPAFTISVAPKSCRKWPSCPTTHAISVAATAIRQKAVRARCWSARPSTVPSNGLSIPDGLPSVVSASRSSAAASHCFHGLLWNMELSMPIPCQNNMECNSPCR